MVRLAPCLLLLALVSSAAALHGQSVCDEGVLQTSLDAGVTGPTLWTPEGAPVLGSPFSVQVKAGPPGASGWLVLGASVEEVFHPALGATSYPGSVSAVLPFVLDVAGASPPLLSLSSIPESACGKLGVVQAVVQDGSRVELTNGLKLRAGVSSGVPFPNPKLFVGGQPLALASGNLNGDLLADLVLANQFSGDVRVLLGSAEGILQQAESIYLGTPSSVTLSDLNGDGNQDIVATEKLYDDICVMLGTGNASFAPKALYPAPDTAMDVATADLDGNGTQDVVTAHLGSEDVGAWLGAGDGSLGVPVYSACGSVTTAVALGDMDGDGLIDAVVNPSGISVLIGTGDGAFHPVFSALWANDIALGDLDADGALDVAATAGVKTMVLLGQGDGSLVPATDLYADDGLEDVLIDDLDLDGRWDISVVGNHFSTRDVNTYFGLGDGTFGAPSHATAGARPRALASGDFNGDAVPDLATANFDSADVSLLLGHGGGVFDEVLSVPARAAPRCLAHADFSGDGMIDLAVGSSGVWVHKGMGDASFQDPVASRTEEIAQDIEVGDLNLDGQLDVAIGEWSGDIGVLLGVGDGTFEPVDYVSVSNEIVYPIRIADVNLDGAADLLAASSVGLHVLLGLGDGALGAPRTHPAGPEPHDGAIADLNGDQLPDVVVTSPVFFPVSEGSLAVLLGNGDGTFGPPISYDAGADPDEALIGDWNADGFSDIAVAAGGVYFLAGHGDGTFSYAQWTGSGGLALDSGDLDGDGAQDLVAASTYTDDVRVSLARGDGSFERPMTFGVGGQPQAVAVTDLDTDGIPDIVTANYHGTDFSLLINQLGEESTRPGP